MADAPFILALDIVARPGKRAVLIVVDKGTTDYSIYEIDGHPRAVAVASIIGALEREMQIAGETPAAIETDSDLIFSSPSLQTWLERAGVEHRFLPLAPIVEALICQHSPEWGL